jgi:ubiquinone/menaquinone biosynthesis C-methylase UbiE
MVHEVARSIRNALVSGVFRRRGDSAPRSGYKAVWNGLADTPGRAKLHVVGSEDEAAFAATAERTLAILQATVGIRPEDTVLEIGCGVGRVGSVIAPIAREWIGTDVSQNMLGFAAERLVGFANVRLVETSGYDLRPVPDSSVDVVYCTVVFMHLEEWDRYNYVLESHRVLRPGGRILVDNFSLYTEGGWAVFEQHRSIAPERRPAHISRSSTPQELETYLQRAGFRSVCGQSEGKWVRCWGVK